MAHSSPGFLLLWVSRGPRWAIVRCQQGIIPLGRSSGRCVSLPHQLRVATCMPGPETPSLRLQNQQHYPSDSSVITSLGRQPGKILFVGSTRWSWILSLCKVHSNWILEVPLIVKGGGSQVPSSAPGLISCLFSCHPSLHCGQAPHLVILTASASSFDSRFFF